MDLLYSNPNGATNSDLAFWGEQLSSVTTPATRPRPRGGVRIFDISNPAAPALVKDIQCDANQNDPIVWDRNGNGIPTAAPASTARWEPRVRGPESRTATPPAGRASGSSS